MITAVPTPTLGEVAAKALQLASPEVRRYWPERLRQVDLDQVVHLLGVHD